MPKELKFDDATIPAGEEAKKIPNAGDVTKFIDRAMKLEEQASDIKADQKSLYREAADQGIDTKALKIVVRHKKNPMSVELRQEANEISEKSGGQAIFAFV